MSLRRARRTGRWRPLWQRVFPMTSFDYLPKRLSLRSILRRFGLLPRMGAPLSALICSCIIAAASWAIEANRLHAVLEIERNYAGRYEAQMQMLAKATVYAK